MERGRFHQAKLVLRLRDWTSNPVLFAYEKHSAFGPWSSNLIQLAAATSKTLQDTLCLVLPSIGVQMNFKIQAQFCCKHEMVPQ